MGFNSAFKVLTGVGRIGYFHVHS